LLRRLNLAAQASAWRRYARLWLPLADALITFTPHDKQEVERLLGYAAPPVHVIPLRIPPTVLRSVADEESRPLDSDLLFVGNFRHPPNEDAARRLAVGILPRISKALPGTCLALVGVDPPRDLPRTPGLNVTGEVPSTEPYLAGTSLVIVPLRQGGGMRVKVLEALAAGKPIIASSLAVAGLPLEPGVHYVPAESDTDFAAAAVALFRDPERCRALGAAALAWFDQYNDDDAVIREYEDLYTTLVKGRL
jgi:glycosyltransferase involved in cell wall biosynthesis